jgi:hypothetical protein
LGGTCQTRKESHTAVPVAATHRRPKTRTMHNTTTQHRLPVIIPSTRDVFVRTPMRPVAVLVRRAADLVMDVLMLLAVIVSIPFVILAVGIPIALIVQLLLWTGRQL